MAKIKLQTSVEGTIDKYEAYRALCEEVGLPMLIDGTANRYLVEDNILYRLKDRAYHGTPEVEKEVYSKAFQRVMLFENLLNVKCFL